MLYIAMHNAAMQYDAMQHDNNTLFHVEQMKPFIVSRGTNEQ
jgi:hypothetical protein